MKTNKQIINKVLKERYKADTEDVLIEKALNIQKKKFLKEIDEFFKKGEYGKIKIMIRSRINSEYKKYKKGGIDWKLLSAIKIHDTIREELKQKLEGGEDEKGK